jgi:acyl carrier protein
VRPHLRLLKNDDRLDPDENLGETGLDSLASIDLLGKIEDAFGIMIPDEALTENTFTSLTTLAELVESLVAPA